MGRLNAKRLAQCLLVLLTGCTGSISDVREFERGAGFTTGFAGGGAPIVPGQTLPPGVVPPGSGIIGTPGSPTNLPTAPGKPLSCQTKAVGPSPMRRLTHTEYNNSVADLLGDTTRPATAFPKDVTVGLFDNTASAQTVPSLLADGYLDTAVTLATNVKDLKGLMGCDPAGASGGNCVRSFVQKFGRRAYRRPLTAAEVTELTSLFTETSASSDPATGARFVIASMLASPRFLFRPEIGLGASPTVPGAQLAGPFELAGRLASLIWASVPDDALLDAAAGGQLQTREQVATQARRLLTDPRARSAVAAFYDQWLGMSLLDSATKDDEMYPQFNDELREAMAEETRRFVDHVLWSDDAKLSTLLTANYSFVNGPLAKLYGVAAPSDPKSFVRTPLDPSQRMGLLTQASLMTAFASPGSSSPIKRGKLVRVRLLCQDLPEPPNNVPPPPEPKEGLSTRERFEMHTNSPACSSCHYLIDGLGFGLEHYDGVGAYRTTDQRVPVDASGEVNSTVDADGPYVGGPALAQRLAGSSQVRDCAPTQWLRYALGRHETDEDTCTVMALREAFAATGGNLRELMVALTQTDAFLNYRQPQ